MKTLTISNPITPTVIVTGIIIAAIAIMANSNQRISILSNLRVDMIVIILLGMMMCTTGIGRVAAMNGWAHPLSILGMIIGTAILIVGASVIFNFKVPYISNDFSALVVVAILIGCKVILSVIHALLVKP